MNTKFRHYICAFLILGFATMGISPACHFVNGSAFIEICKADGSVETVEVPADQAPFETADQTPSDHQDMQSDCLFCFANSHSKASKALATIIIAGVPAHYLSNSGGLIIPHGLQAKTFNATGPPSSIV